MRKLLGLLLAIMGVVFGRAAYENAPTHREDQLAAVTRILTNPSVDSSPLPLSAVIPAAGLAVEAKPSVPMPDVSIASAPVEKIPATTTWQTSVSAEAARLGSTAAVTSATPGDNIARFELVRSIQSELKRLGCYGGIASGNWTSNSKRAMSAFLDRINANLPVEQPDYIQLTLLQGQNGSVCGRDCPKGQSQTDNGRCMPNAIVARAAEKKNAPAHGPDKANDWTVKTTVDPTHIAAGKTATKPVEVAAAEPLPWTESAATAEPPRRPLPAGRMSVGGPLPDDGPIAAHEKLARLDPIDAPGSGAGDLSAGNSESAVTTQSLDPASSVEPASPRSSQIAAISPDESNQVESGMFAQPKVRAVVPRAYAPRAPRAATAKPPKTRLSSSHPQRSVQSLFTHPLGHL